MSGQEPHTYRGFTIIPRTFQVRGTWRWTEDILIRYRSRMRAFSGPKTFETEQAAVRGCHAFGRRIINGRVPGCSLEELR